MSFAARLSRYSIAIVAVLTLGCTTSLRPYVSALAADGQKFASDTATSTRQTRDDLEKMVEARLLVEGLTGMNAHRPEELASIEKAKAAIGTRAAMMQALFALYVSLDHLAAYDAAAEVTSSLKDFNTAVNLYGKAMGNTSDVISPVAGEIITIAGAEMATYAQNEALKKASRQTKTALLAAQDILAKELPVMVSIRQTIIEDTAIANEQLWNNGIGDPSPILSAQLVDLGLTYDRESALKAFAAHHDVFAKAIKLVIERRAERKMEAQEGILHATYLAFGDLIAQHEKIENGEAPDLKRIAERLQTIREYIERITAAATVPVAPAAPATPTPTTTTVSHP